MPLHAAWKFDNFKPCEIKIKIERSRSGAVYAHALPIDRPGRKILVL